MAYVNKNEVLSIYSKVNPMLGVEGEPLFVENMEGLTALITSAFSGQSNSGMPEARTEEIVSYQGITVQTGAEETTEEGASGTQIVNTDAPRATSDDEALHDKKDKGKGGDKDGGDADSDKDGKQEGKGSGKGKGKAQEEGEGSEQAEGEGNGEKQEGKGASEQEDGEEEQQEESGEENPNNSEEEEDKQKEEQPEQTPEEGKSEVEQMEDETIFAYQFKFQQITKLFFGSAISYNTWGSDNSLFVEIENLIKTGLAIAVHDNVVKNYSQYPDRELMIRKANAMSLLGKLDLVMSLDFLKISDDEGKPTELRSQATREQMNDYVTCDKLVERLFPLFFIFRKELFGETNLTEYAHFCLLYFGNKQRFLRIKDWFNQMLETPNYDFYDIAVKKMGDESATVFKKRYDSTNNSRSFAKDELYQIEEGNLKAFSTDRKMILELQMFVRGLVSYYLTNDAQKIAEVKINYQVLTFRAEMIVAYEMAQELNKIAYIKN